MLLIFVLAQGESLHFAVVVSRVFVGVLGPPGYFDSLLAFLFPPPRVGLSESSSESESSDSESDEEEEKAKAASSSSERCGSGCRC